MELKHKGSKKLSTERLYIRKYSPDDTQEIFDNWASSPDNTKGLAWKYHETIEETKKLVQAIISSYQLPFNYHWILELRETGECIGSIGLYFCDEVNLSAQIGYCIGDDFKGKGYATEAVKAVLEFSFNEVEFNRIDAAIAVWNQDSVKVVEKSGMIFEGIARKKYFFNPDGFEDTFMYSILRSDYEKTDNKN